MFGLGIFLGFDFWPHWSALLLEIHWVPSLPPPPPGSLPFLLSFLSPLLQFRPSFNLLTSQSFPPFALFSLSSVTPSTWPLPFLCIPFSSLVNLLTLLPSLPFSSVLSLPLLTFLPFFFPFSLFFYLPSSPLNFPKPPFLFPCKQMQRKSFFIVRQKLHLFAHHVACCLVKFETGQTFEPTTPNISFAPWSRQCWIHLHSSSNISIPWCTAGPNIVRSCCILLACTPLSTLLVQQSWELLCRFVYSFRHLNP